MNQIIPARDHVKLCLHRFFATILCCFLFCITGIYSNHVKSHSFTELALVMSFIASVIFTLCQLIFENRAARLIRTAYFAGLVFILGLTYYCQSITDAMSIRWTFILFSFSVVILVPIAPFLKMRATADEIFNFSVILARQIIFAGIISALLVVGFSLIAMSVGMLFAIHYPKIFMDIAVVVFSLFFSFSVLLGIPTSSKNTFPFGAHFLQQILTYLIIPLLLFYGGILYWYFIVLCITQKLPDGVIVYMVASFGSIGTFTYLALDHSFTDLRFASKFFKNYFFRLLWIPILLMAFSIGIRIQEHGLTSMRFIVVMITAWFVVITIFHPSITRGFFSRVVYGSAALLAFTTACFVNVVQTKTASSPLEKTISEKI